MKTLIDASVHRVTQGTLLVEEAGGTMTEVVTRVREVTDLIAEVAVASSEQIAGVEEIDKAINRMESVTQQNAALVERTASAATAFEEEADRLAAVVGTFKTDRGEDRDRAVQLVKQAVAHVREKGLRRACDDFNDSRGRFCRGNHYIWAGDFGGVILANGTAPDARGQNNFRLKAAGGRLFIQEIIEIARTKGKGWCDYPWKNPITKRTEQKSTYFEAVDGAFIACGIKGKRGRRTVAGPREPGRDSNGSLNGRRSTSCSTRCDAACGCASSLGDRVRVEHPSSPPPRRIAAHGLEPLAVDAPSMMTCATWMFCGPSSRAIACAIMRSPAFAAAKCAKPGLPRSDPLAPVKRIVPRPTGASRRAASRPTRKPPKHATRHMSSKNAASVSRNGTKALLPAL